MMWLISDQLCACSIQLNFGLKFYEHILIFHYIMFMFFICLGWPFKTISLVLRQPVKVVEKGGKSPTKIFSHRWFEYSVGLTQTSSGYKALCTYQCFLPEVGWRGYTREKDNFEKLWSNSLPM